MLELLVTLAIWIVAPAAFLGLVLLGSVGLTTKLTRSRTREACCAGCGYPVAGLAGIICPECGASLVGSGTRLPGQREILRPPVVVQVLCRFVLVAVPVYFVLVLSVQDSSVFVSGAFVKAGSASGTFREIQIRGRGIGSDEHWRSPTRGARIGTIAILTGPAGRVKLRVRDAGMRVTYEGPGGERISTPDEMEIVDVLAWMRAAGVDTSLDAARREAQEIHVLLKVITMGRPTWWLGPGLVAKVEEIDEYRRPPIWQLWAIAAGAVALWMFAMRGLLWQRRARSEIPTP